MRGMIDAAAKALAEYDDRPVGLMNRLAIRAALKAALEAMPDDLIDLAADICHCPDDVARRAMNAIANRISSDDD